MRRFPLLVTGCPRSGTLYTAKLLRSRGFDVGWEHWGRDGLVSWMAAVTSSWVPFGQAPRHQVTFDRIIAITRHPAKVIGSTRHICLGDQSRPKFLRYVREVLGEPPADLDDVALSAWFYGQWMRRVEANDPVAYLRQEDGLDRLIELAAEVITPRPRPLEKPPAVGTHHYGDYDEVTLAGLRKTAPAEVVADVLHWSSRFRYEWDE